MATDGPPWVVGQNCTMTLMHPMVNAGTARGFHLKPDTRRMLLPRVWYRGTNVAPVIASSPIGVRVFEGVVTSRDGLLHVDGTPSMQTAASWHTALLAFVAQAGTTMTLTDPAGTAWTVAIEEVEDRVSTGGTTFGRAWETRLVWVEASA